MKNSQTEICLVWMCPGFGWNRTNSLLVNFPFSYVSFKWLHFSEVGCSKAANTCCSQFYWASGRNGMQRKGREGWTGQVTQIDQQSISSHTYQTQFKAEVSWKSCSVCSWPAPEEGLAYCPACNPDPSSSLCIPESGFHLLFGPVRNPWCLPRSHRCNARPCGMQFCDHPGNSIFVL